MVGNTELEVRVKAIRHEADGVVSIELVEYGNDTLLAATAGSHIDLHLPNGLTRSYSLMNDPASSGQYLLGVYHDPASRGGSKYVHEQLRPGQLLRIGAPRNNFPLAEEAERSVFIAGGIGVTPFVAMAARLNTLGRHWTLYYCAATPERAAFKETLDSLAEAGNGKVVYTFDGLPDAKMLDIGQVIDAAPNAAHFYCCGPSGMLEAFRRAAASVPDERVHFEYFNADSKVAAEGGYDIVLARSGERLNVPPGNTILDVLQAHGLSVPYSCQQGVCGACETKVLSGTPDHRDMILSNEERSSGTTMMVCCSGSLTPELVLDL